MATAYPNQLEAALASKLPRLVLLWGEDAGAIRQAAARVVARVGVPPDDPFRTELLTLPQLAVAPGRLAESAATHTLDGGLRLLWLRSVSGDAPEAQVKALTAAVEALLELPQPAPVLVLLPVPGLLEKTSPLVKRLEKEQEALSVRFYLANQRELSQWLESECRAAGKALESEARELLVANLGADTEQARREVEKLVLYVGAAGVITAEDVQACLAGAVAADYFRLAEAVAARQPLWVEQLLTVLAEQGEDLNTAFVLTLRHLQQVRQGQALLAGGAGEEAVLAQAGKLKAPQTAREAFLRQVRGYPPGRLAGLPGYACEVLATARGGIAPPELTFRRALLALSA